MANSKLGKHEPDPSDYADGRCEPHAIHHHRMIADPSRDSVRIVDRHLDIRPVDRFEFSSTDRTLVRVLTRSAPASFVGLYGAFGTWPNQIAFLKTNDAFCHSILQNKN